MLEVGELIDVEDSTLTFTDDRDEGRGLGNIIDGGALNGGCFCWRQVGAKLFIV